VHADGEAVITEVAQERRSRSHLRQARQELAKDASDVGPPCAAVWGAEGDETAHATRPVQPLDVVSSADAAFGVTDQIDPLTPVIVSQLLDPLGDHSGDVLDRPRVVTAEYAAEVDAMRAVPPPSEAPCQAAEDTRRGEEAVEEQDRSLTAVQRMHSS